MTETAPTSTAPLARLRVLDLTRMHPGAYCTELLADLGADVLKIEAPGFGDGMRFMGETFPSAHVALNRGKRSLTLDLKHERAGEVLRRLARDADVLVESQRPGMLDELGLGFDTLRTDNPRLVWCSITGFGPDGPNVRAPGHDLTYLGYSGLLGMLTVDGVPSVPGTVLTLPIAALMAAVGILSALSAREHTGVGSRVDANMVDSAMWILSEQIARAANAPGPAWGTGATRTVYRCADDRYVTVTASEPKSWAALCEGLGLTDLVDHQVGSDEARVRARLTEVFATRPASHWLVQPGMAGGVGPVHEPGDLVDDPQVVHRHGMVETDDGARVVANPIRIDRVTGDVGSNARGRAPDLGGDTDDALAAAGYTADEITALRDQGVVS